jgi:hypothetical protein
MAQHLRDMFLSTEGKVVIDAAIRLVNNAPTDEAGLRTLKRATVALNARTATLKRKSGDISADPLESSSARALSAPFLSTSDSDSDTTTPRPSKRFRPDVDSTLATVGSSSESESSASDTDTSNLVASFGRSLDIKEAGQSIVNMLAQLTRPRRRSDAPTKRKYGPKKKSEQARVAQHGLSSVGIERFYLQVTSVPTVSTTTTSTDSLFASISLLSAPSPVATTTPSLTCEDSPFQNLFILRSTGVAYIHLPTLVSAQLPALKAQAAAALSTKVGRMLQENAPTTSVDVVISKRVTFRCSSAGVERKMGMWTRLDGAISVVELISKLEPLMSDECVPRLKSFLMELQAKYCIETTAHPPPPVSVLDPLAQLMLPAPPIQALMTSLTLPRPLLS